jgi:hypothetical protein
MFMQRNKTGATSFVVVVVLFFKTGFLYAVLAVLELTL